MSEEYFLGVEAMLAATGSDVFSCYGEYIGGFIAEDIDVASHQFDQVTFNDITFTSSDFSEAGFDKATLEDVTFIGCDLSYVEFTDSELINVIFIECNIEGATFSLATLSGVNFKDCHGETCFTNASVDSCVFSMCDLGSSSFFDANFTGVSFIKCNLAKCIVSAMTVLKDVIVRSCDITDLRLTRCRRTNFHMDNCTYRPYIKTPFNILSGVKKSTPQSELYTTDYSCHLFCSSIDEYNSVSKV